MTIWYIIPSTLQTCIPARNLKKFICVSIDSFIKKLMTGVVALAYGHKNLRKKYAMAKWKAGKFCFSRWIIEQNNYKVWFHQLEISIVKFPSKLNDSVTHFNGTKVIQLKSGCQAKSDSSVHAPIEVYSVCGMYTRKVRSFKNATWL